MDLAVDGITCAACMARIESDLARVPNVTRARVNLTNRRLALEWRDGALEPNQRDRATGRARLQGLSVQSGPRRGRGGAGVALPHALPRGRRLRRHEHHAALGLGVVGQRLRHHRRAARLLPLALRTDRPTGRRLRGPAVLPLRRPRPAGAQPQHGRADHPRRGAGARHVGDRDAGARRITPISTPP